MSTLQKSVADRRSSRRHRRGSNQNQDFEEQIGRKNKERKMLLQLYMLEQGDAKTQKEGSAAAQDAGQDEDGPVPRW